MFYFWQRNEKSKQPFTVILFRMKLNDILLNHDQLESLYGDSLVHTEATETQDTKKPDTVLTSDFPPLKGKFKKKVLWMVADKEHPFLNESDFRFLSQVLEACRMNLDDIYLCNSSQSSLSVPEITAHVKPSILSGLSFNETLNELYHPVSVNQITLCQTHDLSAIQADKSLKAKLWLTLKQILGL